MREDAEKSRVHANQGQQQDLDIEFNERENKEAVQPARNPENTCLCHWHRPRNRL